MNDEKSANPEEILKLLYHTSSPSYFRLLPKKALQPSLLKAIEEIDDLNILFHFIPLLFVKNQQVSEIARQKISELLECFPLSRLSGLDEKIRKLYYSNYFKVAEKYWFDLSPHLLDELSCDSMKNLAAIKILCCHPNGFIRSNAIKSLVNLSLIDALPFLILRANDWVDEIRKFCSATLFNLIDNNKASLLIENLPLIKQLKNKGRYDQIKLIQKIESALITDCQAVLFETLESRETIVSRYAFSILENSKKLIEKLLSETINNKDIIIKFSAFNLAKNELNSEQFFVYLVKLCNDKFMPIRKKVLYEMIELYPKQAIGFLEKGLLDRSYSIRSLCRFYLKQRGIHAFTSYYINALNNQEITATLLVGLSESGNKTDFELIRSFMGTKNPSLQAAIIVAAFKMKPDDWENIIKNLLENPSPLILKTFVNCMTVFPESYSLTELIELVYRRKVPLYVHYFLKIISCLSYDRWIVLNFILDELILIEGDETKLLFEKYLVQWINHNSPNKNFVHLSVEESVITSDKLSKIIAMNPTHLIYQNLKANIKNFLSP
ncbi:hypothetical protein BN59_02762 [Legionella massiliensis]|uniref:HEAT repeat n=1 Tax=Legionella massiliensis TaxID=1034943 RepID=A0A078KZP7_9GAMM|nr:hypothetical protein [Legionella massiliensis]CDZ78452.1 hypothetical protein BN59_02762 [Legionella massiliensis]CEE14190.1 hypothetical protein BN1094_02762 [Legionella massiliensis]